MDNVQMIAMIQAYTGIMGITGEANRGPVRCGGSPIDIADRKSVV